MNAQERAQGLYVKLFVDGTDEDHQTVLLNALAQVEAETWEKAAVRVEQDCWGNSEGDTRGLSDDLIKHNRNQRELAQAIRQRAQRAKEGKG